MEFLPGNTVGIDLGTTFSALAQINDEGEPVPIQNEDGDIETASLILLTENRHVVIGPNRSRAAMEDPENVVERIKRKMGDVGYKRTFDGHEITPEFISSLILRKLKQDGEKILGPISNAVITVPYYFNDSRRKATQDAGKIAGLNVIDIINEPTAAALTYAWHRGELGHEMPDKKSRRVLIYDLGGGTFDVSVLDVADGVFEVVSTNGDTHLGGDDFDKVLIDYIADDFQQKQGIDLRKDPMALQRLQEGAEKAKRELSSLQSTDINLPFITADASGPKHLMMKLTRAEFERMVDHLIERTKGPVQQALADAKLTPSDIDEVVLVGGSTRIPKVQETVQKFFGKEPHKGVNPDEVVAVGAAIQGGVLAGEVKDVLLLDVTPLSLGIETLGGVMTRLVEKNSTIPLDRKQVFSTADDNQTAVTIKVYQGEREMAADNRLLGQFNLENIPPAPRGVPQIEVSFDIDANGILNVKAKDLGTQKEQKIRIEQSGGLSKDEIEKMQRDAELHASEDKARREKVETKNQAESMCFGLE